MMRTFLIVFIACIGVGHLSAFILPTNIDSDLAEISQLSQTVKSLSPDSAHRMADLSCQMITQCCPQLQSGFIAKALNGDSKGVADQCFGEKNSAGFMSKIMACKPVMQMSSMGNNPQLTKYMKIMQKKSAQEKEDMKLMASICTEQELNSLACDWNRSALQDSCQRKVLQRWAQTGDQAYMNKVREIKEGLNQLITDLKKEFP